MTKFYEILGLNNQATSEEIKNAYADKLTKFTSEEEEKQLELAYAILGDKVNKLHYDMGYIDDNGKRRDIHTNNIPELALNEEISPSFFLQFYNENQDLLLGLLIAASIILLIASCATLGIGLCGFAAAGTIAATIASTLFITTQTAAIITTSVGAGVAVGAASGIIGLSIFSAKNDVPTKPLQEPEDVTSNFLTDDDLYSEEPLFPEVKGSV